MCQQTRQQTLQPNATSDDRKGETIPHGETGGHAFVRGGFYHANTSKRFEREKEDVPTKEPGRVLGVLGLGSL